MKKTALLLWICAFWVYALPLRAQENTPALARNNNNFAFDLYAKLAAHEGNIFFSPYSVSSAMAMLYEGARGATAQEISSVMHFSTDESARRTEWERSITEINKKNEFFELATANALWTQKQFEFLNQYTSVVQKFYKGAARDLDFTQPPEPRTVINKWVEDHTNGKIKDLIPQGALTALTRLVLTNAVYFKGQWATPFDKAFTQPADFATSAKEKTPVSMMSLSGHASNFGYADTGDVQAIELPYQGNELSMLVLLPKSGDLAALERSLTAEVLAKFKTVLVPQQVDLYLPRFKLETNYSLASVFRQAGIQAAFTPDAADFSGMDGKRDLYVSAILHQAFVEVNEAGTEAAAATAVIMRAGAAFPAHKIPVFRADHPFLFFIQQRSTGAILFIGRFAQPAA